MTEGAAGRALERRQERRIVVRMPMHVRGTDHQGLRFEELTESENIGRTGAAFATWHNLDLGDDVEITIPLPKQKRSEEHTSELQSLAYLVCRLLLEKKKEPGQTVDRAHTC